MLWNSTCLWVVKGAVYTQISHVFFILFFWVQICCRLLGFLKCRIRLVLVLGRQHLFPVQKRKCSFPSGPNIKSSGVLSCKYSPWTKSCYGFLFFLCHSLLDTISSVTLSSQQCVSPAATWDRTHLDSVSPSVWKESSVFSSCPQNGNFSNYVDNGIGTSWSAPAPLKNSRLACPSGRP